MKDNRVVSLGKVLSYKLFEDDFMLSPIDDSWTDTIIGTFSEKEKTFLSLNNNSLIVLGTLITMDVMVDFPLKHLSTSNRLEVFSRH